MQVFVCTIGPIYLAPRNRMGNVRVKQGGIISRSFKILHDPKVVVNEAPCTSYNPLQLS